MRRDVLISLAAAALASASTLGVQQMTRSFVVNLESPHPIQGVVDVPAPIPHSRLESILDVVVGPASREEPSLWADAGVLDASGFTSVVVSLHGQLRGAPTVTGVVGVILVPEEENVQRALSEGEAHLVVEATAEPVPTNQLYFSGSEANLPVAFPAYRVFVYNTTDRSASVNVFAYLVH